MLLHSICFFCELRIDSAVRSNGCYEMSLFRTYLRGPTIIIAFSPYLRYNISCKLVTMLNDYGSIIQEIMEVADRQKYEEERPFRVSELNTTRYEKIEQR